MTNQIQISQAENQISRMQFATSNGQEIVKTSIEGVKMRNLVEDEPIRQAFRYIFTLIGLKAENIPSDIQKAVLINFVKTELGSFTPDELCLAFRLAVSKKIDVEVNHYQNFSAMYLAEIMESYRLQKNAALSEYKRNLKMIESSEENQISKEHKLFLFWQFVDTVILELWSNYLKTNTLDLKHYRVASIYKVLESDFCFINLTKDEKIEIKKRAEQSAKVQLMNQPIETLENVREIKAIKNAIESGLQHIGLENLILNKCYELAIRDYFSKVKTSGQDLKILIDEIKPNFKMK
jgi:hypothetical protein